MQVAVYTKRDVYALVHVHGLTLPLVAGLRS
jgi:hypothetical protein